MTRRSRAGLTPAEAPASGVLTLADEVASTTLPVVVR